MTDLLEDAIRAGVARGMDEAPAVPDLAERVRALPPGCASLEAARGCRRRVSRLGVSLA